MNITNNELCKEINIYAQRIIKQGDEILVSEKIIQTKIFISKKIDFLGKRGENCKIL